MVGSMSRIGLVLRMSSHLSYINLSEQQSMKHCHPAAERNKQPILETLQRYIEPNFNGRLLEVSSGSGQHVDHIAPHFPFLIFQPTEYELSSLQSIQEYTKGHKNVLAPQQLDVRMPSEKWLNGTIETGSIDYALNINLIHISEWACCEGLFNGCNRILKPGGTLFTYGPYANEGKIIPESNVQFDRSLRAQNSSWGLRDITVELIPLAKKCGFTLKDTNDLPANNKLLVWKKEC